jgi:hypothetical protein
MNNCLECINNSKIKQILKSLLIPNDIINIIIYLLFNFHYNKLKMFNFNSNEPWMFPLDINENNFKYLTCDPTLNILNFYNIDLKLYNKCEKQTNNYSEYLYNYKNNFSIELKNTINNKILKLLTSKIYNNKYPDGFIVMLIQCNRTNVSDLFEIFYEIHILDIKTKTCKIIINLQELFTGLEFSMCIFEDDTPIYDFYENYENCINYFLNIWLITENYIVISHTHYNKLIIMDINNGNHIHTIQTDHILTLKYIGEHKIIFFEENNHQHHYIIGNDKNYMSVFNIITKQYEIKMQLHNLINDNLKIIIMYDNNKSCKKIIYACEEYSKYKSSISICDIIDNNNKLLVKNEKYLIDMAQISNKCIITIYELGHIQIWDVYSNELIAESVITMQFYSIIPALNNFQIISNNKKSIDVFEIKIYNKKIEFIHVKNLLNNLLNNDILYDVCIFSNHIILYNYDKHFYLIK